MPKLTGRDRLQAVRRLVVSTDLKLEGFSRPDVAGAIRYESVIDFPDRLWEWEDYRPGKMGFNVRVWNRPKRLQWIAFNGDQADPVPFDDNDSGPVEIIEDLQLAYLLETRSVKPVPIRVASAPNASSKSVTVEARFPGRAVLMYTVSLETYLPIRVFMTHLVRDAARGGVAVPATLSDEYVFEDSVNVAGVQMPRRVRRNWSWGTVAFTINPDIDPTLFETPPNGVTSRDAWRKWLRKDPKAR